MSPIDQTIGNPTLSVIFSTNLETVKANTTSSATTSTQNSLGNTRMSDNIGQMTDKQPSWDDVKSSTILVENRTFHGQGQDALLHDIEKQDDEIQQQSRERSASAVPGIIRNTATNAAYTNHNRKLSVDYSETMGAFEENSESSFTELIKFIDYLKPKFRKRTNYYSLAFVFMGLILITTRFRATGQWFLFYILVVLLDVGTTILDEFIFAFVVDKLFINHYDTAYLLHGFNGPLGAIIMLVVIELWFNSFEATSLFPQYDQFISAITMILLCLCVKNYYIRKHYITLLETRFTERIFKLETYTILLSELATAKPPKKFQINTNLPKLEKDTSGTTISHGEGLDDANKRYSSRSSVTYTEQYFNPFMKQFTGTLKFAVSKLPLCQCQ